MNEKTLLMMILAGSTGAVAGYLGSLMLSGRMVLMGGAMGHLTLPGIALALMFDFDVALGGLVFLGLGALLIGYLKRRTRLHLEALTAVVFSTSLAAALLFLPRTESEIALLGDVSRVTTATTMITAALAGGIYLIIRRIYGDMVLMGISEDLAAAEGVDVRRQETIYLICVALTVALGVRIVGGLMTAALLAIPACTAKNISTHLSQYALLSMGMGALSALLGIFGHALTGAAPGPLIIIASAVLFAGSVIWLSRRSPPASQSTSQ